MIVVFVVTIVVVVLALLWAEGVLPPAIRGRRRHREVERSPGWAHVYASDMDDMPLRFKAAVAHYIDGETSTLDFLLDIERPPLPGDNASAVLAEARDAYTSTRRDSKMLVLDAAGRRYNERRPPIGYGWDHSGELVPYSASFLKQALQRCDDAETRYALWQAYRDAQQREAKQRQARTKLLRYELEKRQHPERYRYWKRA